MNKKQSLLSNILTCMICLLFIVNSIYGADAKTRSWLRKKKEATQESMQTQADAVLAPISQEVAKPSVEPKNLLPPANTQTANTDAQPDVKREAAFEHDLPLELRPANTGTKQPEPKVKEPEAEEIEFHFENASLQNLITQIEEIFGVTFITDDILDPLPKDGKTIKGNKISFKTQKPLTKRQAWNLFITFLDIAGFNIVPMPEAKMFRIVKFQSALKAAVKSYIGIEPETLPEGEEVIRYVYFIENSTVEAITNVVNQLKSPGAELVSLREHRAFIITDKAYNIKMLMKIVKELDQVSMPQSMAVLKLRRTDALEVKKLYDSLINNDEKQDYASRLFASRKQPTSSYFPENTRIIAEPRTNSLILLGSQDAIQKIEDFIVKNVDVDIDMPYPKLQPVKLKYADASTVAEILTNITKFGGDTAAGKNGGVRGGDKYLKPMLFTPVRETNTLVIQGDYEDYLQIMEVVKELDAPQPQIAVEVLVLSLVINPKKGLGTQMRTKVPGSTQGLLGNDVVFQTSGFLASGSPAPIVENSATTLGVQRLLGNLVSLANTAIPGNTLLTLGADALGVWGIFNALQTVSNTEIVSSPFMIVANKAVAKIEVGEARRIIESQIIPSVGTVQTSEKDDQAVLSVQITPQINASDGKILLDIVIVNEIYSQPVSNNPDAGDKNKKEITTSTLVTDGEVLALGGFTRNNIVDTLNKVPILGDIPVLGWFFKNKLRVEIKENLLILISTRIVESDTPGDANKFTQEKIAEYRLTETAMHDISEKHDPVHNMFFAETETEKQLDEFLFERDKNPANKLPIVKKAGCCADKGAALEKASIPVPHKLMPGCCPELPHPAPELPATTCEPKPKELKRQMLASKKRKTQKALADYLPEARA